MANNPVELLEKELVDLLGLKNDPGMTYEDYFDALKEAAIAAQMNQSKYSSDQATAIRDELKRIREKIKNDPEVKKENFKFRIKSVVVNNSKINKDNVSTINKPLLKGKVVKFDSQKFLPKSIEKKPEPESEDSNQPQQQRQPRPYRQRGTNPLIRILKNINRTLSSILDTLNSQSALDLRNTERQRRERERERRAGQESSLEGIGSGIKKIAEFGKKMLAPLESIWDRIVRFFTFVLLGKAFFAFMKWMSDPENKKKFDIIVNFLSKHWLAIVGAYILFGTSLGGLVRFILKSVIRLTAGMLKIIPRLLSVIAKSKFGRLGLAATALFTAGAVIPKLFPKTVDEQERKVGEQKGTTQEKIEKLKKQKENLNFFERYVQGKGSEIDEQIHKLETGQNKSYGFSKGGIVPSFAAGGLLGSRAGIPVTGAKGDDTIIAAKTGEAVLTEGDQKDIYEKYGLNIPEYLGKRKPSVLNSKNIKPKMGGYLSGGIIQGFSNGGVVGKRTTGRPVDPRSINPKISASDYHALMAIAALEADDPQGRSDVAQSIYNRLFGATHKNINFYQNTNTLKDIITAGGGREDGGQYEPTFDNKGDWLNITDMKSAALAVMNSSKGKKWKWTLQDAMEQIKATELALKDPKLQKASQSFVGGRPNFYGTSEQPYMKPDKGDVLRNKNSNFFTANPDLPMGMASPIPEVLLPKIKNPSSSNNTTPNNTANRNLNPLQRLASSVTNIISGNFLRRQEKPVAKSKPGTKPSKPSRSWWDPRGWIGKKGGGIIEQNNRYDTNIRQIQSIGSQVDSMIDRSLPSTMADYLEQSRDSGIPLAPITLEQIQKGKENVRNKLIRQWMQYHGKMKGGGRVDPGMRAAKLAGSLIKIAPIDTMPDRPMTGFRDMAEVMYSQNRRGISGLKSGGRVDPKMRTAKLAGSLINIAPIDTMPDRPMTGFRDMAEVMYSQNRRGISGLKKGGSVDQKMKTAKLAGSLINISPIDTMPDRPMIGFRDMAEVMHSNNSFRRLQGSKTGGVVDRMKTGGTKSYKNDVLDIRSMIANSMERQGKSNDAFGLRAFGMNKNMSSFFPLGLVKDNTGFDIKGGTDDRQLTALQPGEYVIPQKTVSTFGQDYFDKLVSSTDVNSEPAKMGMNPKNMSLGIKPYTTQGQGSPEIVNLPPVNSANNNTGVDMSQSLSGSKEVFFSPICEVDHAQSERQRILDTLGVLTN